MGFVRRPEPDEKEPDMSDDEGGGAMGWVIFILIFGVGNYLLYHFTGIFIIPIPRR